MSIQDGQEANALNFNAAFASKTLYQNGKISLANNTAAQTTLAFDLTKFRHVAIDYQIYRATDSAGEIVEIGQIVLAALPAQALDANKWKLFQPLKVDDGTSPGVTFLISIVSGVVTLQATTTNLAGTNHSCMVYYNSISTAA